MDCPEAKRGEVEVACPPEDSLVEIFSRLHAKPLFRFKCVSKPWCDLIADRLRCRKFPQTLEGFFTGGAVESYGGFINLSDSERPVPLVDPSFSFLTESPEIEKIVLLDSCNGLVLFEHRRVSDRCVFDSLGYIVCNPATEEWVSVPSSGWTPFLEFEDNDDDLRVKIENGLDTYLIFDPAISPHFELIQIRLGRELVFSSVSGAWRELEGIPGVAWLPTPAVCDGILYVSTYLPSEISEKSMIVAVGGEGRPSRTLHWPDNRGDLVFIGQSQGHLHCVSGHIGYPGFDVTELSIWVLEDYVAEKWVLRDNASFSQLFQRMRGCLYSDWDVVSIHPDSGLVFFVEFWNRKLISYDMDKKEVRALCSLHGYRRPIIPYVPYFAHSAALAKKR